MDKAELYVVDQPNIKRKNCDFCLKSKPLI